MSPARNHIPGRRRLRRRSRPRRGAILVTAIWVIIILAALVLVFARSMQVEVLTAGNRTGAARAAAVEKGAEQYVIGVLMESGGDALTVSSAPAEAMRVGTDAATGAPLGYFWILRPTP